MIENTADTKLMKELYIREKSAREKQNHWRITESELLKAYELGERRFSRLAGKFILPGAQLPYFQFEECNLGWSNFSHANLHWAEFRECRLVAARFNDADLNGSVFHKTDLSGADFTGANLANASFVGADMIGVIGLKIICPVGGSGRLIYAYVYEGKIRIQCGCHNGTPKETRAAIERKYGKGGYWDEPDDLADYLDAVALLEKWGQRELERVKALSGQ